MPRVVHFEIHADDPERAIRFYQSLFGWQFQKWDGPMEYWMLVTGKDPEPGINGGLLKRQRPKPIEGQSVNAFVCTVQVPAIDDSIASSGVFGGALAIPKMPIPGMGWLAYVKDTEGNILGLMQLDPNAK